MTESIEQIVQENLQKCADYDESSSQWHIYYDDLYELIDTVLAEFSERSEEAKLRKVAEFQQSSNMDRYFEIKKLKTQLTACINVNKGLISRNQFLEEESDKYRNMVFDKMEHIDKAAELLKKWIEPKYDREELLYLTEQFLKEVEK